ncbi:hypothetical protein HGRIS_001989 [Hohenbuehelia grisea]|uniref:Uncharacterized protein n=1 Tax=Hohenbuehelia grisea TaxID=104357 RepID=A0ABR3JJ34_9AGAR
MAHNEDAQPDSIYKYAWLKGESESIMPLDEFLKKYKPSMIQDDGTKPWVWIGNEKAPRAKHEHEEAAVEEGKKLLEEVTAKIEAIKNDDSIPVRSNKKTGAKSKKELREALQAEATEKLKAISIKHGYVSGKWLIFAAPDKVDMIWSSIAASIVSGPLSSTPVRLAKVATSPPAENPHMQHLICIYMPDVYDKDAVAEVMRVLLRDHGANLSGVKTNLYTHLGIDSKHPSGISSTVWKNTAVLKDTEIKELREAFFAGITRGPKTTDQATVTAAVDQKQDDDSSTKKPKPKLQRKKVADNPFASDDEQPDAPAPSAATATNAKTDDAKSSKPKPKKKAKADTFASDDEDDDEKAQEEQRKQELKAKKSASSSAAGKRPKDDDQDDDDDDERPKKRPSRK